MGDRAAWLVTAEAGTADERRRGTQSSVTTENGWVTGTLTARHSVDTGAEDEDAHVGTFNVGLGRGPGCMTL